MHNTAVLIFANSSKEELRFKPFAKDGELFDSLTEKVIKKVEKSNLTYFHISEKQQQGRTFGEKFSNAVQHIFDLGFDKVITVGNDTPHLQTQHIKTAAESLIEGNTVVGPSQDGGFYLMGIQKAHFNKDRFAILPWQKSHLLKSLLENFQENRCTVIQLPVFRDIDDLTDVVSLINHIKTISILLRKLLACYLEVKQLLFFHLKNCYDTQLLQIPFNKGSPVLVYN